MVLRIITVGKISGWSEKAFDHFSKMISRYCKLEHVSLKTGGDLNRESPEVIKRREAERIIPKIRGVPICLDRNGEKMSSEDFARFLKDLDKATFVIGGPIGLDENVLRFCRKRLSLSEMTLSHEVAFVVLLEQIFRSFRIMRGERYHY